MDILWVGHYFDLHVSTHLILTTPWGEIFILFIIDEKTEVQRGKIVAWSHPVK